jgi:bile acid:Na+ symporter, BASS family
VAVLQLVPFAVGLAVRAWAPATAATWMPPVARASNLSFLGVLAERAAAEGVELVELGVARADEEHRTAPEHRPDRDRR